MFTLENGFICIFYFYCGNFEFGLIDHQMCFKLYIRWFSPNSEIWQATLNNRLGRFHRLPRSFITLQITFTP